MRYAIRDDLLELLRMGGEFATSIGKDLDREQYTQALENLMESDEGFLIITDGGMAAGILFPSFVDGKRTAQELWWWVDPEVRANGIGGSLLSAFEAWAIENDAQQVLLTASHALTPRKIGKLYKARGYVPQEHVYVKEF